MKAMLAIAALAGLGLGIAPKANYAKDAKPVIDKYCVSCHSGEWAAAKIDFTKYKSNADVKTAKAIFKKSIAQLKAKKMPPAGSGAPTSAARTKLIEKLTALTK